MKKVGSGQITITDLMDGELTLELTSNLSRVQTYSSSAGLNPDWTVTNLRLAPIVRFNGQIIENNDKNLSFSYLKKINSQAISKLDSSSELIDETTKELVVIYPQLQVLKVCLFVLTYKFPADLRGLKVLADLQPFLQLYL